MSFGIGFLDTVIDSLISDVGDSKRCISSMSLCTFEASSAAGVTVETILIASVVTLASILIGTVFLFLFSQQSYMQVTNLKSIQRFI